MLVFTAAGRLGRDAEIRDAGSNRVCGFTMGVDVGFGDRKETYWVDCSLWGPRGEKLVSYLTKGTPVSVVGRGSLRQYEKKDGSAGVTLQIDVLELTFQGRGQEAGSNDRFSRPAPARAPRQEDFHDDDIPF